MGFSSPREKVNVHSTSNPKPTSTLKLDHISSTSLEVVFLFVDYKMGWLWSSSPRSDSADLENDAAPREALESRNWNLTEEQRQRIFSKSGTLQNADQSRDAQADKELEAFLNSLSTADATSIQSTTATSTAKSAVDSKPEERTNHDRILPDGSINISPMALYPRSMSCRQAFDQAFYCQSLGGKFNDIYRFGKLQSCSEQWGAFWFCMRIKSLAKEEKETQIRDYYAAREERMKKEGGNSENVWEMRTKPVEKAFWKDPDAVDDRSRVQ